MLKYPVKWLKSGGEGVKLENLWNKKKPQINSVVWQHKRFDNNNSNKAQANPITPTLKWWKIRQPSSPRTFPKPARTEANMPISLPGWRKPPDRPIAAAAMTSEELFRIVVTRRGSDGHHKADQKACVCC